MIGCEYAHDDGAYVLGALSPAERAAYERHLPTCSACREAVAEIAVLPGLLGRLDEAGLERVINMGSPPPAAESRSPALVSAARAARRRERRINRLRYAAAALVAASLALVAGVGLNWLRGQPTVPGKQDPQVTMVAMQPLRAGLPVQAKIGLDTTKWGTEVTMWCAYQHTGADAMTYTFRLVAHSKGGKEQVMSWLAGPGDEVTFTVPTRFARSELERLDLTQYDGTPLLTYAVN